MHCLLWDRPAFLAGFDHPFWDIFIVKGEEKGFFADDFMEGCFIDQENFKQALQDKKEGCWKKQRNMISRAVFTRV